MFKQLRDATPEEVQEELEHCRRENRRPVRVPRYFRGFFTEEKFSASMGFEMQVFRRNHASHKLILYLHGGAFIYPPVFFHWRFLHDLTLRTHCDALLPVYPKSPEYDCEYSVQTVLNFYRSISESGQYNEIHLVGDSAGACLCLIVAQEAHKNGWQKPATTTLLSPCVDLSHTKEKEMRALQGKDDMLQLDRVITLNAIWQGKLSANRRPLPQRNLRKSRKNRSFPRVRGHVPHFRDVPHPTGIQCHKRNRSDHQKRAAPMKAALEVFVALLIISEPQSSC